MKKRIIALSIVASPIIGLAQGSKVQTAWRNISDYESSKDVASLIKAKEALDLAIVHEDTKEKAKTWLYQTKVHYYLYQVKVKEEQDKLTTVTDKNEKIEAAYGKAPVDELKIAIDAIEKTAKLDKDGTYKSDITNLQINIIPATNNVAIAKYKIASYADAADFFKLTYVITKSMMGAKDTSALYNAVLCAQKLKSAEKVKGFSEFIISEKVYNTYTYQSLMDAKLELKDTAGAFQTIKEGKAIFPNDSYLLNKETELYIHSGKKAEALANLDKAIEKDPKNGLLYLVRGNVFDNMANLKSTSKEVIKEKEYEELVSKAEVDYKKSCELAPKIYDGWYNLGVLYNNWAVFYQNNANNMKIGSKEQKEGDEKALAMFNKAITAFEKVLEIKPDDKDGMQALRMLYMRTKQTEKEKAMAEKLKK
jgi:tetratricopeptide (TPR) repeat protein